MGTSKAETHEYEDKYEDAAIWSIKATIWETEDGARCPGTDIKSEAEGETSYQDVNLSKATSLRGLSEAPPHAKRPLPAVPHPQ